MATEPEPRPEQPGIEMPRPTAWPVVLSLGIALAGAGLATSLALSVVGVVLLVIGIAGWVGQLLPGRGHQHEPRVEPAQRPGPIIDHPGTVEKLRAGMAGYRMRLPEKVHPISAGIKGGIVGGLIMPIPALAWGLLSGNGLWFPINLLAGMVLPGLDALPEEELRQFHFGWLVVAVGIHAVMSIVIGLVYGVLLPTLPSIKGGPIIWGGLVMPLVWTWASHGLMGVVNPVLQRYVDWPFFILSQVVFGIAASLVVVRTEQVAVPPAGPGSEGLP